MICWLIFLITELVLNCKTLLKKNSIQDLFFLDDGRM